MWGLLALRLADDKVLPMKYEKYASELYSYALAINSGLSSSEAPKSITVAPLFSAIKDLHLSTYQLTDELNVMFHLCINFEIQQYAVMNDLLRL